MKKPRNISSPEGREWLDSIRLDSTLQPNVRVDAEASKPLTHEQEDYVRELGEWMRKELLHLHHLNMEPEVGENSYFIRMSLLKIAVRAEEAVRVTDASE